MRVHRPQPHLFAANGRQRRQLLHQYVGLVKGSQGDKEIMSKVGMACTTVGGACTSSSFVVVNPVVVVILNVPRARAGATARVGGRVCAANGGRRHPRLHRRGRRAPQRAGRRGRVLPLRRRQGAPPQNSMLTCRCFYCSSNACTDACCNCPTALIALHVQLLGFICLQLHAPCAPKHQTAFQSRGKAGLPRLCPLLLSCADPGWLLRNCVVVETGVAHRAPHSLSLLLSSQQPANTALQRSACRIGVYWHGGGGCG